MATNVENRVVEMRFDNAQFESGVKTSLSTIDRLKKALNFNETGKGLGKISTKESQGGLNGLEKSVEVIAKRFTTLGVIGTTVLTNITNKAMQLGHQLMNAVSQPLVQGGINRAMNIAQAQFQIKGLKQDWGAIKDIVNEVVTDTAFGFDEAAKAAAQLGASGMEAGEKLETALKGIAGTAAMTNSSFTDIADIFTTVAGQGKLMSYQLNQLSFRGLNAAAELGKALGKSEADIREMVTKGEISFETFSKAMYNAFGAHAKEANDTFTGALANMKAAFARIGADFATPAMENLRPVFLAIKDKVKEVHGTMGPLIESASNGMKRLSEWAVKFIKGINVSSLVKTFSTVSNVLSGIAGLIKTIKDRIASMIPPGITKQFKGLSDGLYEWSKSFKKAFGVDLGGDAIEKAAEEAKKAMKPLYDLQKLVDKVINGDFGNGKKRVKELHAIDVSYAKVQNRVNKVLGVSKRHKETTADLAAEQRRLKKQTEGAAAAAKKLSENNNRSSKIAETANTIFGKLGRILAGMKAVLEIAASAFSAFYKIILKPGITKLLSVLLDFGAELGDRLVAISKWVKKVKPFEQVLWGIRNAVSGIFSLLGKLGRALGGLKSIGKIVGGVAKAFAGFYKDILKPKATKTITTISNGLKKLVGRISDVAKSGKRINPFRDALKKIKDYLQSIVKRIGAVKDAIAGFEPVRKTVEFLSKAIETVVNWVITIKEKFKEFGETVQNLPGVMKLMDTLKELGESLKNFAIDKFNAIGEFFKGLAQTKLDGINFGSFNYSAIDAVASKLSDLIELMMKASSYARDFLGGFGEGAIDSVKKLSDGFGSLKDNISVVKGQADGAADAMTGFFSTIIKNTSGIFEHLKGAGKNVIQGIIDAVTNVDLDKASKLVKIAATIYIVKHIVDLIKSIKGAVDSTAGIPKKLAGVFSSMSSAIDKYAESLNTSTIEVMATAILKIAGAMVILSGIPSDQLVHISMQIVLIILALSTLTSAITGFTSANTELSGVTQSIKTFLTSFVGIFQRAAALVSMGLVFLALAAGVAILGKTLMDLAAMNANAKAALAAIGIISLFIYELSTAIGVLVVLAGVTQGKLSAGTALAFVGIAIAVKILAEVAQDIATNFEPGELKQGLIGVTVLMAIMTLMSRFARPKGMLQLAAGMVIISLAIWTLVPALAILSKLSNLGGAIMALAGSLTVLAIAAFAFSNKKLQEGAIYVVGISTALLIFAAAMRVFAPAAESLGPALIALAALTAFLIVGAVIGSALMPFAAGLLLVAAAFVAFSASVAIFGAGLKMVSDGLTLLGDGINQFVNRFIDTLSDVSQRKDEAKQGIADTIKAMAEGVSESLPQIVIAASSLMMAFAQAIIKSAPYVIAAVTTLSSALLTSVILGIAGIAGVAIQGLVLALYSIAIAIVDNAEPLFQAQQAIIKALTYALLVGIYSMFEPIAKLFGVDNPIHEKLNQMKESLKSEFTYEEGKSITQPFAQGAADGTKEGGQNLGESSKETLDGALSSVTEIGDKIVQEATNTKEKAKDAADGGAKEMLDAFMSGDIDADAIYKQFGDIGESVPEGFMNGSGSGSDDINKMIGDMMNGDVIDPAKNILDSHSPSKVFIDIGKSVPDGLAIGIKQNASKVTKPIANIVKQLTGSVKGKGSGFAAAGKSMVNSLVTAIKSGGKNASSATKTVVSQCTKAIKSNASKMRAEGRNWMTNLKSGITAMKGGVSSAAKSVGSAAKRGASGFKDDFKSIGKDMARGLQQGIASKIDDIAREAAALVRKAINAAKKEADSNSPSKKFIKIGKSFGEGLIIGIDKLSDKSAKSSANLISESISSSQKALSDLASLLDADAQPVIRPIVDASGVYATAADIESLFGDTALGVNGNVGAITRMMRARQNGSDNSDIISAINRLQTGLENAPRNTYQFGNVTYGDDSAVSTAVGSLIRAIKMEGRM